MHHFHIADDHPLFRNALLAVIHQYFDQCTISESYDLESTLKTLQENANIDLLLLDLNMPGSHDLFGLITVREKFPSIPVAIISANENPSVINRAMGHGASAYILKSLAVDVLHEAIKSVVDGEHWLPANMSTHIAPISQEEKSIASKVATLTPQQYRVLCYLREGKLNKQIAYELGIAEATIKAHVTAIFRKLGITNRTQAVIMLSQFTIE